MKGYQCMVHTCFFNMYIYTHTHIYSYTLNISVMLCLSH